jgi:acyl carrier protein
MPNLAKTEVLLIIATALEVDPSLVAVTTQAPDLESWDSIGHLAILVALDHAFGGKIADISDLAAANSVAKIVDLLEANGLL